jgi:hypothetical protein
MSTVVPICRTLELVTFRGDRSRPFAAALFKALDAERRGKGPGPAVVDCLLLAGHSGVTTDGGTTIYGFNPDGAA